MQCRFHHWCFLGIILCIICAPAIPAQDGRRTGRDNQEGGRSGDRQEEHYIHPHFRRRAVVLEINARVIEQNQDDPTAPPAEVWSESYQKTAFHETPVEIRLVSTNLVVVAQFTPILRRSMRTLEARGQIWIDVPGEGIRYHTTTQTITIEFNEPIYFFPLGQLTDQNPASGEHNSATIEIMIILHPFEETEE